MASCKASCMLLSEGGTATAKILGHLSLSQVEGTTSITGSLSGLTPGKHGISVCVSGNLSQGSASCGPIFNPFGKTHGSPEDANHMVGDLGNIEADENGNSTVNLTSMDVQLIGPHSVLGRSIVVYAGQDDQGRGGHENSGTTGNAGPRVGAGVIGLSVGA